MVKLQIVEGDFLEARGPRRLLLATGHGQVGEKDLTLSMSVGSAKILAEAYPEAPRTLGKLAWWRGIPMSGWHLYGLLVLEGYLTGEAIGLFQTKRRWGLPADPLVIAYSTAGLAGWLRNRPGWEAHVAFPEVKPGSPQEAAVLEAMELLLGELPVVFYRR
jgi:hypothetical protein